MSQKNSKYWVIIPAAGTSRRAGKSTPKQYQLINNKPVIEHAITPFLNTPFIEKIVVVLKEADDIWPTLSLASQSKIITTEGGENRAVSVFNGLKHLKNLKAKPDDWVLVHDAARPCLSLTLLNQLINSLKNDSVGGIPAIPVTDTLKYVTDNRIERTVKRESLFQAQTPQMFRYQAIYQAVEKALIENLNITDEANALEIFGKKPKIVPGDVRNVKITYGDDLELASFYLD